ncbi:DoxX family protein [Mucilaginibacter ginsenosidivorans]|uniref:DoxX family protein n=1 Tax=Mucilaginibacter ginsenosidivorans TaxID=398053 RepID=A0A5B8UWF6_9SPHI|nr:DoxX family protein [Mucilaginibacter ginsenosidivorans]QEC63015.1 DoxX family protein [Mucilaginibacter ginsenosidivorans]
MQTFKKVSLIILVLFYVFAGINHFRNPVSYLHIIPPYIPYPVVANALAGCFEVLFAVMMLFAQTRKFAAWGIILMLLAFLPVHISMIGDAPLKLGNLVVTPLLAWVRLLVLQPLLILWAWWHTSNAEPSNYSASRSL